MSLENGSLGGLIPKVSQFTTTHWSVVLAAGLGDTTESRRALEQLCSAYWYPLYVYIRRRGYDPSTAEDLTQSFFAQLLERNSFATVTKEKGKFRSFLLGSLNHFLSDERDRQRAQKRGGDQAHLSFDAQEAEQRYQLEPVDQLSPDKVFERRWAMALLDQVLARLRQEFSAAGKTKLFEALEGFLVPGNRELPYAEVAAQLGSNEETIKKSVQRMRNRYRDLFRHEIAQTVNGPEEVEEELRHLCEVMSSE